MRWTKKELEAQTNYHRSAVLAHLEAYNRKPSMEPAAFEMAAKHAAIFVALVHISDGK